MKSRAYFAVLFLTAGACAGQEQKQPPPAPAAAKAQPPPAIPAATSENVARSCQADADCPQSQLCSAGQCVDITASSSECQMARVHFDYDASTIRDDDRPVLDRLARCLRAVSGMHITIEGNADERGTTEYNLALGQRRALEVEKYLSRLGASAAQLKTISYGEEKPMCREHNEDCWAKNRRAALKPMAQN